MEKKMGSNNPPVRIMIADDHTLFRQALRQMCEIKGGFEIVAEAENGLQAIDLALELQPDVVLMDINMPEMDGVAATQAILEKDPSIKILFLTMYSSDQHVFEAIRAGALGYLLKDVDWQELVEAVETVYNGGALLKPSIAARLLDEFRRINQEAEEGSPDAKKLTDGEMDVLLMVARGIENDVIAEHLKISKKTVANRLSEIYTKLGVSNRTQAALYALRMGWSSLQENE